MIEGLPMSALVPQPGVGVDPSKRLDLSPAGIERTVEKMLQLPQAEMPLRHHFAPGVCVRELTMPAGALVIGHKHRFAELNIMLTGRLTLLNANGTLTELVAPQTFVGKPGQKIAYIHETVIWQNVWVTNETDIETIENHFLDKSPTLAAHQVNQLALAQLARQGDRDAFAAFLKRFELTAAEVRKISEIAADLVPLPPGSWKFQVGNSAIEGKGLLSTATIQPGEVIAPARILGHRTPAGRYTNHAAVPNAEIRPNLDGPPEWDLVLVATREIIGGLGGQPGEEITVSYAQVIKANQALAAELAKNKGNLCQPQ